MITKGFIINKVNNSNKYLVRIPIFETAGINQTSNECELNSSIAECTVCYNPGTYDIYKEGDCVFVGFEDNKVSKPVILGKLFVSIDSESVGYQYNKDIRVTNKAVLPENTTIGGVSFKNISTYFDWLDTHANATNQSNIGDLSLSEKIIGTWIDGKTIYRKTYRIDVSSYTGSWDYTFSISDLGYENIWQDMTNTFLVGNVYSLNQYNTSGGTIDYFNVYITTSNNTVTLRAKNQTNNEPLKYAYITLCYTKQ